jgi:hypothetical protein
LPPHETYGECHLKETEPSTNLPIEQTATISRSMPSQQQIKQLDSDEQSGQTSHTEHEIHQRLFPRASVPSDLLDPSVLRLQFRPVEITLRMIFASAQLFVFAVELDKHMDIKSTQSPVNN